MPYERYSCRSPYFFTTFSNFAVYQKDCTDMMHHSHKNLRAPAFILICEQTSRFAIHPLSLHSFILKLRFGRLVACQISHGGWGGAREYIFNKTVSQIHFVGKSRSMGNFNISTDSDLQSISQLWCGSAPFKEPLSFNNLFLSSGGLRGWKMAPAQCQEVLFLKWQPKVSSKNQV